MLNRPDPKTKREFVDRLMSYDFTGDMRAIGKQPATLARIDEQTISLTFPDTGRTYVLSVHIPRVGEAKAKERRSFEPAEGSEEWDAHVQG